MKQSTRSLPFDPASVCVQRDGLPDAGPLEVWFGEGLCFVIGFAQRCLDG
jgi:hypothetical protein